MNKKVLIAILVLTAIGIAGGLWWFYTTSMESGNGENGERSITDFFFPSGREPGSTTQRRTATTTPGGEATVPIVRQISARPVAGFTVFTRAVEDESGTTTEETVIRYIERETGHIFETTTDANDAERVTNTTIPRIQTARWLPSRADELMIRYLDEESGDIKTFSARIETTVEDTGVEGEVGETTIALEGDFLTDNIAELAVSPGGDRLFGLLRNASGGRGITFDADGGNANEVFDSPSGTWNIAWPEADTLAFTAKPSASAFGFLYFLDPSNGSFDKILGNIPGLTVKVAPSLARVLYSESVDNTLRAHSLDRETGETDRLPVSTLPEKCTWARVALASTYCAAPRQIPQASYPDAWYQGVLFFDDLVWRMNLDDGSAEVVYTPQTGEGPFDMVRPQLTEDDRYFFFMNKRDGTLWSIDLQQVGE